MSYHGLVSLLVQSIHFRLPFSFFFFFNDTATTEIYTLSLHDALPIYRNRRARLRAGRGRRARRGVRYRKRSEEHTSELQSQSNLVCRLLLEKKKKNKLATHLSDVLRYQHRKASPCYHSLRRHTNARRR